jgi:hypothetical protein
MIKNMSDEEIRLSLENDMKKEMVKYIECFVLNLQNKALEIFIYGFSRQHLLCRLWR